MCLQYSIGSWRWYYHAFYIILGGNIRNSDNKLFYPRSAPGMKVYLSRMSTICHQHTKQSTALRGGTGVITRRTSCCCDCYQ